MEAAIQKIPNAFPAVIAFRVIVLIKAKNMKWAWDVTRMGLRGGRNVYVWLRWGDMKYTDQPLVVKWILKIAED